MHFKEKEYNGEKYGYICITCGKTIKGGVNTDGECAECVEENRRR